jgi:type VI secretion system protein ImpE
MWVPLERVRSLAFEAPQRPRDLLWRRAAIEMKDGQEGIVYLPVIYPFQAPDMPDALRLGRATDWPEAGAGPVRGVGQRVLLAGEEALPITAAGTLRFA